MNAQTIEAKRAALHMIADTATDADVREVYEAAQHILRGKEEDQKPYYNSAEYWEEIERRDREMDEHPERSLTWEQVKEMLRPDYDGRSTTA